MTHAMDVKFQTLFHTVSLKFGQKAVNCENISPTFLFCEFILLQRFLNILQGLHPNNPSEKSV